MIDPIVLIQDLHEFFSNDFVKAFFTGICIVAGFLLFRAFLKWYTYSPPGVKPVPGKYYHQWSLMPLLDLKKWTDSSGDYLAAKQKAAGGASVFKFHAGIKMIAITDHVSGQFFFSASDKILDREKTLRFAGLGLHPGVLNGGVPTLVSNVETQHDASRRFAIWVIQQRHNEMQGAFDEAAEHYFNRDMGKTEMFAVWTEMFSCIMFRWLLDASPPPVEELLWYRDHMFVPQVDTLAGKAVTSLVDFFSFLKEPVKGYQANMASMLSLVRNSRYWSEYREFALQLGLPEEGLENIILFMCIFNSCFAIGLIGQNFLAVVDQQPKLLHAMQRELDGRSLRMESICSPDNFPVLDGVFWETMRLYMRPPFFTKKAKQDFAMPAGDGEYQIRKGDLVYAPVTLLQTHDDMFPHAFRFEHDRYERNPEAKKHIFAMGYANYTNPESQAGLPWGCAAHIAGGYSEMLTKMSLALWIQRYNWRLEKTPCFGRTYMDEVLKQDLKSATLRNVEE